MSESNGFSNRYFRVFMVVIIAIPVIVLAVLNIGVVGNVLLVLLGFGAVVLVHEFGHFVVAKASGIKVEAFSLFMPPILLGVQRTENGIRFRIMPEILTKKDDESGEGALGFTVGRKGQASETEYRIGLIPFGGFVKMLGQDDTAAVKATDDPRSYANKPVHIRAAVLAAGVTFNVISAVIIFMIAFLKGIDLPPAVVGGVLPNSPAAHAGLKAGDEIIQIAGKAKDLDFSNIALEAALSGRDEQVAVRVRRTDGEEENLSLVAEPLPNEPMRGFGIVPPQTLAIAELSKGDASRLFERTGLRPGDRITAVNGKQVHAHWELEQIVQDAFVPTVTLSAERVDVTSKEVELVTSRIDLILVTPGREGKSEPVLDGDVYSMVPRLRITEVLAGQDTGDSGPSLAGGDIVLAVGDIENPTYEQLREVITEHEGKELPIKVLRDADRDSGQTVAVTVVPKRRAGEVKVMIGVHLVFDLEHPVIATTVAGTDGSSPLAIPPGASITAVDGLAVSNFFDVAREIGKYPGERITIDYRLSDEEAGAVAMYVSGGRDFFPAECTFAEIIPFDSLKRTYKAGGPVDAVVMGYRRTVMFVAQTYLTLKRLLGGLVSPKNLMGPVGIITFSYRIVSEQPLVYYVYFLGLISAVIAVFNFLPLPPLDGGLVVLLLVEKAKGSALTERVQTIIAYAGWALILTLILYVTFNDIVRSFFS
ncbi:MAG: M50 family metallopeptidase [Planctomycetota bacterium]|jgi:regulator of sigma E protease